jgi:glycosyltransferase involved in cell wall biosynthesis
MKILFLTDNFPPEVNAPASRTYEHCREWVKQGMEVTVITCAPNFPQGSVYPGYKNKLVQREQMDGIEVIRVWSYIAANEGFIKRVLDYVSFAIMAFVVSLPVKCDVVVATSPQFFTAVGGYLSGLLKRKPWIMEVRDLWPESIRAVGAMKDGRAYRMLERLELFLYRKAKLVIVVTDSFKSNLIERGIPANKIEVVKNGVLLDQFMPREKDQALLRELCLENQFILAYFGTHGMAHGLDFIIRASVMLPVQVHVLLVGDGAEKEKLIHLLKSENITNVTMLPSVAKTEMMRYISISDVALVNLRKSDTFKTVIPSKIFENAAMHKPILLGVEGESKDIIETYNAGICFEPENEKAFIHAVNDMLNPIIYQSYQSGCQHLAEQFDRKILAQRMLGLISVQSS